MWHYIYWYVIYIHPIHWLYGKALEYNTQNIGQGVWLAIAVFGITAWFGLCRFLAETPGRRHGNTYVWWILIAALHVWAIPIYIAYDILSNNVRRRWQDAKEKKLSDRSRSEIYTEAWDEKRAAQRRGRR